MLSEDSRLLCPTAEARDSIWAHCDFKVGLAAQYGVDVGYEIYRAMLGLPDWGPLRKTRARSLQAYAAERAIRYREIFPAGEFYETAPPKIIGPNDARSLWGTSRSFFVACLAGARVHNESLMITIDGEPLLDFQGAELASIDETLELDPYVFHASGQTVWSMPSREETFVVDEAFGSLLGRSSATFGHWIWEFLPKYLTALASGAMPRDVPVLCRDAGMPPQLREALRAVVPEGTEIVAAPPAPIHVNRLWCAPSLFYSPYFEKLTGTYRGTGAQCFPAGRFRPSLDAFREAAQSVGAGHGIERLYLARKPDSARQAQNAEAIETLARARGFEVVYPEQHSFADQLRAVRDAKYVLGPQGSATYLNFFAAPGTKSCMLHNPYTMELLTYTYLLELAGIDVTVFTGDACGMNDRNADSTILYNVDYAIDERTFTSFLDGWLGG